MNLSLVIKAKGWVTLAAGAIFLLAPEQFAVIMGATMGEAGVLMTQLFGLVLVAVGWSLVASPVEVTAGSKSLAFALTDTVAIVLLVWAINKDVFGVFAYELAAVYGISACIFFYKGLFRKNATALSGSAAEQTIES